MPNIYVARSEDADFFHWTKQRQEFTVPKAFPDPRVVEPGDSLGYWVNQIKGKSFFQAWKGYQERRKSCPYPYAYVTITDERIEDNAAKVYGMHRTMGITTWDTKGETIEALSDIKFMRGGGYSYYNLADQTSLRTRLQKHISLLSAMGNLAILLYQNEETKAFENVVRIATNSTEITLIDLI